MATFLLVLHLFTCLILVLVVLVQSGKDGGIGMMSGGGSQTVFGSSGGANFFTKFTAVTAAIFMTTSIVLTAVKGGKTRSIFDTKTATAATIPSPASATGAAAAAPAAPTTPANAAPAAAAPAAPVKH